MDLFSNCIIVVFANKSATALSIILEFFFGVVVVFCGVKLNEVFLRRLRTEKLSKPIGRRGNIMEPLMKWFCRVQILFWPIKLLHEWTFLNEIIKFELMPIWLRYCLLNGLLIGRTYIAFHSFFCAFIRYLYIVYYQTANQWDFQKVCKWFQFASIMIPILTGVASASVIGGTQISYHDSFNGCVTTAMGVNSTKEVDVTISIMASYFPGYFTTSFVRIIYYVYIVVWVVFGMNITEAFLYYSIFAYIER